MKVKRYKSFLEEASSLSIPDLKKPSNPKVTQYGPLRGDVLLGKIENDEDIKLKDGKEAKVELNDDIDITNNKGEYDPSKSDNLKLSKSRLKNSFTNKKTGEKLKVSDFVKTSEFGGGGGSSLGTVSTRVVETIQAYVFAYKQKYSSSKNLMVRIFEDEEILNRICSCKEASGNDKITPEIIKKHKDYFLTFIKTANRFISRGGILNKLKRYNFYQMSSNSEFSKSLNSAYRRCSKNSLGLLVNMAKWTPSDVWAVNSSIEKEIIRKLDKINTITELNQFIDFSFGDMRDKSRNVVGISLKKISSRRENILVVINKETERPKFEVNHISLSTNSLTKGLDVIIRRISNKYPGFDKINVRSNSSGISNINIEILGSSSRHGKCSLTQINSFLKSHGLEIIPSALTISKIPKKELYKMVMNLYNEISDLDPTEMKSGKQSNSPVTLPYLVSKYQALLLAKILVSSKIEDPEISDSLITSIMYYALSIENQYFKCPRYARIVEY